MVWRSWGRGQPVLLLHGGHGSWTHWLRNIDALVARGHEVWAPDLPGFGESALPPSGETVGPGSMLQPLRDGLQAVIGDSPCDVVAFSFGTMVAGLLAAAEPARVRSLVVVGAAGLGFLPPSRPQLSNWRRVSEGPERDAVHRANLMAQMLVRPHSCDAAAVSMQARNAASYRLRGPRDPGSLVLSDSLAGTRVLVAAIWGEGDAMVGGQREIAEQAIGKAPGHRGTWWIAGAGHWVQYDAAAEFDAALQAAMQACAPAA